MIWVVGSGQMAEWYIEVLKGLNAEFLVIGRSEQSAQKLQAKHNVKVVRGGLKDFLSTKPAPCSHAIIAVGVEQLYQCCDQLLDYGIKNILTEKPGALDKMEIDALKEKNRSKNANVLIAYNRRFYSSVLKAEEIIQNDGGIISFNFEFTEWSHVIEKLEKPNEVMNNWLYANSSHVIDLAFFLGGWPSEMQSYSIGADKLKWHPANCIFAGAGRSSTGALFNYSANWLSPGRWGVEILTPKHRLYFRPMEQLQIQQLSSVKIEPVEIENQLDTQYKPGLYLQTKAFLEGNKKRFSTIEEQGEHFEVFEKIRGQAWKL